MRSARRIQKLLTDLNVSGDDGRGGSEEFEEQHSEELLDDEVSGDASNEVQTDGDSSQDSRVMVRSERLAGEMAAVETREGERMRTIALEAQLAKLIEDRRLREAEHLRQKAGLENELACLRQQTERDLAELKERQSQVEEEAPKFEEQLKATKGELRDLTITPTRYDELRSIPEGQRSLREHVLMLTYERMQRFQEELEEVKKERDLAREALARGSAEVERVKREAERAAAAHARDKADANKEVAAVGARNERLEKDLQEATVQVEVLTAKGAMYDQVKEKAETWERQCTEAVNERLLMATKLHVVDEERGRLHTLLKEKEHTLELLQMDKAYLRKEVESLGEQVQRLDAEVDRQQHKMRDLKTARQQLYDRLLAEKQDVLSAHEQRLQGEIGRVQARAAQDLESIRRESADAMEREVRTLREMRDAAAVDCERAQAELKENKRAYEELLFKYREQQQLADTRHTELWSQLKMKGFDLDRLQLLHDETSTILKQTKLENEMLHKKVKLVTESYHSLDTERAKKVAELQADVALLRERVKHYDALDKEVLDAVTAAAQGSSEGAGEAAELLSANIPLQLSEKRRIQHTLELAKQCTQLQHSLTQLHAEHAADQARLAQAQKEAAKAREQLNRVAQPHSFLLHAIQRTEAQREHAKQQVQQLQTQLRQAEGERERLKVQLQRIRGDMHRVIEERMSLDNLRHLLQQQQQGSNTPSNGKKKTTMLSSSQVLNDRGMRLEDATPVGAPKLQRRMYELVGKTPLTYEGEGKIRSPLT